MNQPQPGAPVVLTVRQFARRPLHLLLRDRVTFGRDCDGFLLADTKASRRHAEVRIDGGQLVIVDLGSSNGTLLNGRRISGSVVLAVGDIVGIGSSEIVVGANVALADTETGTQGSPFDLTTEMESAERPRSSIVRLSESMQTGEVVKELTASSGSEGTFTIVFSDIENSTARATAVGDQSWLRVLEIHNHIVRRQLVRYGGREIKSQGDGFMMSFDSARRAVMFAIGAQQEMTTRRALEPSWDLQIRLGVHTGEAVRTSDGDLYGRHVITASRIADQAEGGEILVSALVRELTAGKLDLHYDAGRSVALKGLGDTIVHRVKWEVSDLNDGDVHG